MADALQMLGRGTQIAVALGAAYLIALWFVLVVWTFRDIEARSRSVLTQIFSTLLVVLFFVPGVLLYLILRPKETLDEAFQQSLEEEYLLQDLEELPLCPGCHRYVEDDFLLCPNCHSTLREPCRTCTRLVELRWALCPYCGTNQIERGDEGEQVEVPAARWSAPALRRRRTTEVPPNRRPAPLPQVTPTPAVEEPAAAEPAAMAAAGSESAPGLATIGGMRSIVRPFDRFRSRPAEGSDQSLAADAPEQPVVNIGRANGRGHRSGAAHHTHRLFDALNGKSGDGASSPAGQSRQTSTSTNGTASKNAAAGPADRPQNGHGKPAEAEAEEPALVRVGGESD